MNIQELSYQEQKAIAENIFKTYREAKLKVHEDAFNPYPNTGNLMVRETCPARPVAFDQQLINYLAKINSCREYMEFVERAVRNLPESQQLILKKDYLEHQPSSWWMSYFSRSTYYRQKHSAILAFLKNISH